MRRAALAMRVGSIALAMAAGGTCAPAATAQEKSKPVLLRLVLKPGTRATYDIITQSRSSVPIATEPGRPPTAVTDNRVATSTVVQTVLKATVGGGGVVRNEVVRLQIVAGGRNREGSIPEPATTVYDAYGRAHGAGDSAAGDLRDSLRSILGAGPALLGITLPNRPVHAGDSWTLPFVVPGVCANGTIRSTLVSIIAARGRRLAEIRSDIAMPISVVTALPRDAGGKISMQGAGSFHNSGTVDVADGHIVRLTVTGQVSVTGAMPKQDSMMAQLFPGGLTMKSNIAITMTAVPGDSRVPAHETSKTTP